MKVHHPLRTNSLIIAIAVVLCFVFSCSPAFAQRTEPDSSLSEPNIGLQFVGGSLTYAAAFWGLSGHVFFEESDSGKHALGPFFGTIFSGLIIPSFHEWLGNDSRSFYVADFIGTALGGLFSISLYNIATDDNDSRTVRYLSLSIPPVFCGVLADLLFRQPSFSSYDADAGHTNILVFPSFSTDHTASINFMMGF